MIDRLFANLKTTIVGLIIFLTGAVLVGFEKATLTEFGAFIGVFPFLLKTQNKNQRNNNGQRL